MRGFNFVDLTCKPFHSVVAYRSDSIGRFSFEMIEYIYLFSLFKIHFGFRPVLQKERLFATVALFLLFGILTVSFSDRGNYSKFIT